MLVTFDHSHGPVVASVHGALKLSAAVLDLLGLAALPDSEAEGSGGGQRRHLQPRPHPHPDPTA